MRYTQGTPDSPLEVLDKGRYPFEVVEAEEKISKAGNDKIELRLKITGRGNRVLDNLVFVERAFWKIDQFLAATGHNLTEGKEVDIQAHKLIGKRGIVELGQEPSSTDPEKIFNRVDRYILPDDYDDADRFAASGDAPKEAPESTTADSDDEIPF